MDGFTVLGKSKIINCSMLLILCLIVFFIFGLFQQHRHFQHSHQLVQHIQNTNNTLVALDKLQQFLVNQHQRITTSDTYNNVQNFQFFKESQLQFSIYYDTLLNLELIECFTALQLKQLNLYYQSIVAQQHRIVSNFELSDAYQQEVTPIINAHSLVVIELNEFLHQLKSDMIIRGSELAQQEAEYFMYSEQLMMWLLFAMLFFLLITVAAIFFYFYLNTYLYQHIKSLYQQSPCPIVTIDDTGKVIHYNEQFNCLVKPSTLIRKESHIKQFIGNHWLDLLSLFEPFEHRPFDLKSLLETISDPSTPLLSEKVSYKLSMNTVSGVKPMILNVSVLQIFNHYRAIITLKDQSERHAMEARANIDNFTNIANKSTILERLQQEIERAKRHHIILSVIFIDIDEFKEINDKYGHPFGDKVIKWVASSIKKRVRDTDFLGRYGGDEFLIVCPDCSAEQAESIALDIRRLLQNPKLHVKASVGVAQMAPQDTLNTLIERADTALYQAKHEGKNKVVVHKQQNLG